MSFITVFVKSIAFVSPARLGSVWFDTAIEYSPDRDDWTVLDSIDDPNCSPVSDTFTSDFLRFVTKYQPVTQTTVKSTKTISVINILNFDDFIIWQFPD